jgi:uncharacterized protein
MSKKGLFFRSIVTLVIVGVSWQYSMAEEVTRLSIGTAGTGGGLYPYGGAVANVVSKYEPTLDVTVESTGGSVEDYKLLDKKKIEMATVSYDVTYQAFYDFKNSKHFKNKVDVRALFNMYTQPTHVVTLKDNDVKKMQDLIGKRVGVGSPGSGTEVKSRVILKALDISYKDFTPEFLSFAEASEALQDGTIKAEFVGSPVPNSSIASLAITNKIRLVPFSDSERDKIIKDYPYLTKAVIPGGAYKGVDTDTNTVAVKTVMVCQKDLPDEIVYKFVKAVFEHKDELNMIHPSFKETTLENATPILIPVHPGAIKYFKEKGVYKEK